MWPFKRRNKLQQLEKEMELIKIRVNSIATSMSLFEVSDSVNLVTKFDALSEFLGLAVTVDIFGKVRIQRNPAKEKALQAAVDKSIDSAYKEQIAEHMSRATELLIKLEERRNLHDGLKENNSQHRS